jgi:hypothetical protein
MTTPILCRIKAASYWAVLWAVIALLDVENLPWPVCLAPDLVRPFLVNVGPRHRLVDLIQQVVADSNRMNISGSPIRS